ncbi:MAG: hypothetical protein AB7I37_12190 [Pirellulales bacterium]
MSLKLNVGLQKKVGLPDYGSLGASCHVEFEVDGSLIHQDLDGFHQQVRNAFVACQQAVNDQLARQQGGVANGQGNGNGHSSNGGANHGHANGNGNGYSNGHQQNGSRGNVRLATASQARAIRAIAGRQRLNLDELLGNRFGVNRPEDLSISDASSLIDELKSPANGSAR